MQIWELLYDGFNDFAVLVSSPTQMNSLSILGTDGNAKHWDIPPMVEPFIDKRKKKAKPRADLSYLIAGALTLNQKAYVALKDFLLPFGQLLELDCQGDIEYFYNVTNLISCIDFERSEKKYSTVITKEIFLPDVVPEAPTIFKDPHTAMTCIYINQAGKEKFEQLAAEASLFGARFVPAGQGLF